MIFQDIAFRDLDFGIMYLWGFEFRDFEQHPVMAELSSEKPSFYDKKTWSLSLAIFNELRQNFIKVSL